MDHLRLDGRFAHARGWAARLPARDAQHAGHAVGCALHFEPPLDHYGAHQLDGVWVGGIEKKHRRRCAGVEAFFALLAQQVAHGDGDIAKIDIHRAGIGALVADGAVVGNVAEFVKVPDRYAAPRLFLVQKRLDQQRSGEDLVAWRVKKVGARHVGRAHRFAFTAAQAVFDGGRDVADFGLFQDQRLGA